MVSTTRARPSSRIRRPPRGRVADPDADEMDMRERRVYLFAEAVAADPEGWLQVMPLGTYQTSRYGEITITPERIQRFARNFHDGVRRHGLPVNREHVQELGAVGWFRDVQAREDGLYARIDWSEDGLDLLAAKAFKFFSPEYYDTYVDPVSGQTFSDVLVGCALTNYPQFSDIAAIAAAEDVRAAVVRASESYTQIVRAVSYALSTRYGYGADVTDVYEDHVVYEANGQIYSATYTLAGDGDADDVQFGMPQEMQIEYVPVAMAEWTTAFVNDLPDSSFAYVEPGGEKDDEGKTKPRSTRHFPIKDASGKPDAAHVRNALARAAQSPFGEKAMPKIRAAAKALGIGEDQKKANEGGPWQMADGTTTHDHAHQHGAAGGNEAYTHGHVHAHAAPHDMEDLPAHRHGHDIAMSEKEADMAVTTGPTTATPTPPPAATQASEGNIRISASELATLREQAAQAPTAMAEARKAREALRLMAVDDVITSAKRAGRIVPSQEKDYRDRLVKASDGDFEWLRNDILSRPKVIELGAIGSGEQAGPDEGRARLHAAAEKFMSDHKDASYRDALLAVAKEDR